MTNQTSGPDCEVEKNIMQDYYTEMVRYCSKKAEEIANTEGINHPDWLKWDNQKMSWITKSNDLWDMDCYEVWDAAKKEKVNLSEKKSEKYKQGKTSSSLDDFINQARQDFDFVKHYTQNSDELIRDMFGVINTVDDPANHYVVINGNQATIPWWNDTIKYKKYMMDPANNIDIDPRIDSLIEYEQAVVDYYIKLIKEQGIEVFCAVIKEVQLRTSSPVYQSPPNVDTKSQEYKTWMVKITLQNAHYTAIARVPDFNKYNAECWKLSMQNPQSPSTPAVPTVPENQQGGSPQNQPTNPSSSELNKFLQDLQNNNYELPSPDNLEDWFDDKFR